MTNEQVQMIADAIKSAMSFTNASAFEHVFGPCEGTNSLVQAVSNVASELGRIADELSQISDVADALEKIAKGRSGDD